MISEDEYNSLQKAKHNAEYLAMLEKSFSEAKEGNIVIKNVEDLETL